ncbi:tail fiber assembly protein [Erwinia sorbitola]|uniref:Tail fiber assembly protein n=1 Tax=Erwinia sorbitola TaxID=2681984 RepID=A0ABW9R899_9GAMM|nr:tail fiber assembly protein [Erwinia sorbitola]MTD26243.1 hypothetical protein [Erwinia sorbitola]
MDGAAPKRHYKKWDGEKWVTDTDAQHQSLVLEVLSKQASLIDEATKRIAVWQTKLLMGRKLSDDDSAALNAWMDYIDAVEAIDVSTVDADMHIAWPAEPAGSFNVTIPLQ